MILRLLFLPIIWVLLIVGGMLNLVYGSIHWVITGERYTIRLQIGN